MRFAEVHGHTELKQRIARGIKGGKIPHAQLYLGPEGSGKLALALASVQMLFCTNPQEEDSCGSCASCQKISKHIHPDVHYCFPTVGTKMVSTNFVQQWREALSDNIHMNTVDWVSKIAKDENKTPNITREESREIINKLSLKPFEGHAKAMIIWMPEYLDKIGNSLLKIIEEPPQKTYFILVATEFDRILSTITSRTQLVKVPAYSSEELESYLKESYQLDARVSSHLSYLAEGNIRLAKTMVEDVDDNYAEKFRTWMLACHRNDLKTVAELTDDIAKTGRVQIQIFLQNALKIFREALLYKNVKDYQIRYADEYRDFIQKFSQTLNSRMIEQDYELINDSIYHIGRNANAKISLFNLSLGLRHNFLRQK
jgi:DNA polymerase-3 subunit delta'